MVHSRRRISSWLLLCVAGSKNEPMTARQTVLGVLVRRDKFKSECTEFYIRWYVFALVCTQRTNYFIVVGRHFCLNGGSNFAAAKVLQINCSKGTVNNDYVNRHSNQIQIMRSL